MKGVILAGGKGTRLYPLTRTINKHLLPVGPEPMIYNPIRNMAACGIRDVRIVTSSEHMGQMVGALGSGSDFGLNFSYSVQDEANGIADALRLAEHFVGNDNVLVLLGDNVFEEPIDYFVDNYRQKQQGQGARVLLVEVADPQRFGVAALDEKNVVEIQEKPECPKSNYAVVGAYIYDCRVFDIISHIKPSARGEYEITSVNNRYIELGTLQYDIVTGGRWMDTGTFESYYEANCIMFEKYRKEMGVE
ncbi:NTP transferase domain-containing protein [Aminithiophilus ramosus]|uniref:glucose-1-phosphate thymidylyltransferase n=1 Tax=Aminithiophilus ramosus TaxID=3029084 RepID=A0A9Q7AB82_9BACT|nr:sugar phosphate nucleotidyltransferase [Aminithiophilus ramosus]QTX31893.1 NTP transferase domain-containing protein [Aminithiophilus ramosus]